MILSGIAALGGFIGLSAYVSNVNSQVGSKVTVYRAKKIRIEADAVVAYADGERLGALPIDVEVRQGALLVFAPQ